MHVLRFVPVFLLACALVACGKDERPPVESPPGVERITGRERIGWTQPAASAGELTQYRYLVYINGSPAPLDGASCSPAAGGVNFDCSAPLPPLTQGRYTIQLATVMEVNGATLESPRSAALEITVGSAAVGDPETLPPDGSRVSSDGLRIQTRRLAAGLLEPADIAVDRGGRVFVAQRDGTVQVVLPEEPAPARHAAQNIFATARDADPVLLSIALGPDFERDGLVYVAFTAPSREADVLQIARLRDAGGRLGEMAVISSYRVPDGAAVTIRFGPDRHLYAAVSSGREGRGAQDPASAAGKILRIARDGRIPDDSPWSTAVHSVGHGDPRGLAWHPSTGALFVVERDGAGDEINEVRRGANYGWPLVRRSARHPFVTAATLVLPAGSGSSGLAAVDAPSGALHGDLIVAAAGAADLLRVRLQPGAQPHVAGGLLEQAYGRVGPVASGADGSVYFVTANGGSTAASEVLVRVTAWPRADLP